MSESEMPEEQKDQNPKARRQNPRPRKNTKLTGEHSEAAFLHRASGLGFGVARPWGDSLRYDFILDNGQRLWRIQIKCTESLRAGAYESRATYTTGKGRAVYTRADVDFLAVHVVPLDIWYIVPVEVCAPAPMLRFYPHREAKKMRLEKYREAWHLLQSRDGTALIELHASADETITEHVGTAALGCPVEQSSTEYGAETPVRLTWLTPRPRKIVIPSEPR